MSDAELSGRVLLWRIERPDGAGLALTSHDRPVVANGIVHRPAPGMMPRATTQEGGLSAAAGEVEGVLSSEALTESDLRAGRWDGARVTLEVADWMAPEAPILRLAGGSLGNVTHRDGRFAADLTGAAAMLDRPVCPVTSAQCRAELGDPDCAVDVAGRRREARGLSLEGNRLLLDVAIGEAFRFGRARLLSGEGCGLSATILAVEGSSLVLRDPFPFPLAEGTRVELFEGCDKRFATCRTRFANAINFRGEPHLPGNDLLTRYPGA